MNVYKFIGAIILALFTIFVIALIFAYPTMWLWNWLMPTIFGLTKITVWQALGLSMLSGLLIRSPNYKNT